MTSKAPSGRVDPLRHDPLCPELASVLEHRRAVFSNVLVKQDARLGAAQKPAHPRLAFEQRERAQIFTVEF